ncbi:MAG TPA: VWA domain-containing protein [Gemmatimonas sp.]|nr:VWA domain-containing protein [Gemmatimonas sp.]
MTAVLPLLLLAVDPTGLGGAVLDHPLHESARGFTDALQCLLPGDAPVRRVPIGVTTDRLIGGVDLAATLNSRRLVAERGVLAGADRGVAVFPMAERLSTAVRVVLADVLDTGTVQVARDGIVAAHEARIVAVLLDESMDDEIVHPALADRVAFRVRVTEDADAFREVARVEGTRVREAALRLSSVSVEERWLEALCQTADAFGVDSLRAPLLALRCARAHAALAGRLLVTEDDAEAAAALVLAPRATRMPAPPPEADVAPEEMQPPPESNTPAQPAEPPQQDEAQNTPPDKDGDERTDERDVERDVERDDDAAEAGLPSSESDILRAAVTAALPPGLLAALQARLAGGAISGREGAEQSNMMRGRPRGARAGMPRGGARLHLLETLRAAAPWQRVRATATTTATTTTTTTTTPPRIAIRREDFRVRRFVEKTGTTVIFVVDASGSSALNRLSEAKGAIEMLLAESYARRDRVSLVAFRGAGTEVLLAPTRALARAKGVLAAMPGGGGTPMAHAIECAMEQALLARRAGSAPLVAMLTDGRANIARDGTPGRPGAERDAITAGRAFAALGVPALFVDTSTRGEPVARRIADAMRARYITLPAADARALSGIVKLAIGAEPLA